MGAVQKLATVVIVGLTGLATLIVVYLADEEYQRDDESLEQQEVAIERGIQTYVTNCLVCHGPAGEGSEEKLPNGEPARVGAPIGGNTRARLINQTDDPILREERENQIRTRIQGGSPFGCSTIYPTQQCAMPPWGEGYGGEFNEEQIEELVLMIQHVDWDLVYNEAIAASGGYPTPQVAAAAQEEAPPAGGPPTVTLEAYDIGWRYEDQPGPSVEMTVAPGTIINVVNTGAAHNFQLDALGINQDVAAGETVQVEIPADAAPGTYEFICNIPGHAAAGMVGTLIVDPNATAGQPAASPGATPGATPAASPPAAQAVQLEAWDIGWRTADQPGPTVSLTVAPGTTIAIVNTGVGQHNFDLAALGIFVDLPPGGSGEAVIPADAAPGEYEFICNIPGHAAAGMRGTLIVQ